MKKDSPRKPVTASAYEACVLLPEPSQLSTAGGSVIISETHRFYCTPHRRISEQLFLLGVCTASSSYECPPSHPRTNLLQISKPQAASDDIGIMRLVWQCSPREHVHQNRQSKPATRKTYETPTNNNQSSLSIHIYLTRSRSKAAV